MEHAKKVRKNDSNLRAFCSVMSFLFVDGYIGQGDSRWLEELVKGSNLAVILRRMNLFLLCCHCTVMLHALTMFCVSDV